MEAANRRLIIPQERHTPENQFMVSVMAAEEEVAEDVLLAAGGVAVGGVVVVVAVAAGGVLPVAIAGDTPQTSRPSPKRSTPKKPERVKYLGNQNPCCLHFINI
jgi:hypothetical protein